MFLDTFLSQKIFQAMFVLTYGHMYVCCAACTHLPILHLAFGRHLTSIEISQLESMSPFACFPTILLCCFRKRLFAATAPHIIATQTIIHTYLCTTHMPVLPHMQGYVGIAIATKLNLMWQLSLQLNESCDGGRAQYIFVYVSTLFVCLSFVYSMQCECNV